MNQANKEDYIKAGKIASQVVDYAKKMIRPGMLLIEIARKIEGKIKELDGGIAFPVNLSVNEIAAHYTPGNNDEARAEGLLCVDIGVEVEGCIADTAFSLDLTSGKHKEMIKLNEDLLNEVLKIVKPGTRIGEIGSRFHGLLDEYNKKNKTQITMIKNLTGHSLGENMIHAGLTIPNYRNESRVELEDIAIAIEPFLTEGMGEIYEGKPSEIFMLQNEGQVRDPDARKILKFIKENYKTKPFCKRWLEDTGMKKVDFSLSLLVKQEIIHNFPVLIEKSKKPVSQAEHTVLVNENAAIVTTL